MVNKVKLGLVVGGFISFVHLLRVLAIAIMPNVMQSFVNWIFSMHFLNPVYLINPTFVTFLNGLTLVVLTFIVGFVIGLILGTIWNMVHKK